MAKNNLLYFTGTVAWAKVSKPDEKYGHYSVDAYLTPESWDQFHSSGLQLEVKENDDGEQYVRFRRDDSKKIRDEIVEFGKPKVFLVDEHGNATDFDGLIGNGSTAIIKVSVFDTARGKGHRLEAVGVTDLVKYDNTEVGKADDMPF